MARQLSEAARAAKECRKVLKKFKVKGSVRSSNYSMGNSVNITVQNIRPEVIELIKSETNKFQMGHFDGMTDCYEYSNRNDDIPQTKFLFVDNSYSQDLYQKAWDFVRADREEAKQYPADYQELKQYGYSPIWNYTADQLVYMLLNGSYGEESGPFWDSIEDSL